MKKLIVTFTAVFIFSSLSSAEVIHFVLGSDTQIKSHVRAMQEATCVDLNLNTRQENPTNRVDDDGNGYIDDTHGFNFQTGYEVHNEFDEFYLTVRPKNCSKWIPIVVPTDANDAVRARAFRYIFLSPLYGDTLTGDLGKKIRTQVNVHFPADDEYLTTLTGILHERSHPGATYILQPYLH